MRSLDVTYFFERLNSSRHPTDRIPPLVVQCRPIQVHPQSMGLNGVQMESSSYSSPQLPTHILSSQYTLNYLILYYSYLCMDEYFLLYHGYRWQEVQGRICTLHPLIGGAIIAD